MKIMLLIPIRLYQWLISPLLGPCCRFHPSCSDYAIAAIQAHGAFWGNILIFRRICRCHPWGGHGYDPVPLVPHNPCIKVPHAK